MLAGACRTRAQLGGLSTVVILLMSAMGGSMFPRFLMPESIRKIGNFTFNAHALDGYQAVFWRDAKLIELWPQVAILGALTIVFLTAARMLARRWETV
jgi:ABC-2 type transport system permease protein